MWGTMTAIPLTPLDVCVETGDIGSVAHEPS